MPPVGDLDRVRALRGCRRRRSSPPGPGRSPPRRDGGQPGGERVRGPFRQDVHGPAGLDVDQQRPVEVAAAQRELIDAQHPRARSRRDRAARGAAGSASSGSPPAANRAGQPGAGPAAQRQRDRLAAPRRRRRCAAHSGWSARGPAQRMSSSRSPAARQKNRRTCSWITTSWPPPRYQPAAAHSGCAPAATPAACRAGRRGGGRAGQDPHRPAGQEHPLDPRPARCGNRTLRTLKIARRA